MSCPSMWPKQFWSDQIDMDLTIMIWLWPKWIGHNQNDLVGSKLVLLIYHSSNLDPTNSFWSWPNHYGQMQINLVRPKPFWTDQSCFGHIEGQGIRNNKIYELKCDFGNILNSICTTQQNDDCWLWANVSMLLFFVCVHFHSFVNR